MCILYGLLFTSVVHYSRITNATGWSGRADCHPGRSGGWTREEKMGRTVVGQSVATAVLDNAIVIITTMIMIVEGHAAFDDADTSAMCQRLAYIYIYIIYECYIHPYNSTCYFFVFMCENLKRQIDNNNMFGVIFTYRNARYYYNYYLLSYQS
jgi:hypothetical protein